MNVLYIGQLWPGSTALHRRNALRELGCQVTSVDTTLPFTTGRDSALHKYYLSSAMHKTNRFVDWKRINAQIRHAAQRKNWQILWVDKGLSVERRTLLSFKLLNPNSVIVHYSPDDMFNPANQSKEWLASLTTYDLFVTTKTYNVPEYKAMGAKDAFFVGNGFEPSVHKPLKPSQSERVLWGSEFVFIGAWEHERAQSLQLLASKSIQLGLFGGGASWRRLAESFPNIKFSPAFVADENYSMILCCSQIAGGFLRKQNRDLQTTRSVEIPACGVFMLAERSDQHLELFEEGREAEFFASDEELLDKTNFYLANPARRNDIARAGRLRCIRSGYSNKDRLRSVMKYLGLD